MSIKNIYTPVNLGDSSDKFTQVLNANFSTTQEDVKWLHDNLEKVGVATETQLGGIKASPKTDNDIIEVKIGADSKLYVAESGLSEVPLATENKVGGILASPKTPEENAEIKIGENGRLYGRLPTGGIINSGIKTIPVRINNWVDNKMFIPASRHNRGRTSSLLVELQPEIENTIEYLYATSRITISHYGDITVHSRTPWNGNILVSSGADGRSAYETWLDQGYSGSEQDFLAWTKGDSAYEIAVEQGFVGTKEEWLISLIGLTGDSAYEVWLNEGHIGSKEDFLNWIQGDSAYEIALIEGFIGTKEEWLESLVGTSAGFGQSEIYITPLNPTDAPTATITSEGPDTEKKFTFRLGIPRGSGDASPFITVVNTWQGTVGNYTYTLMGATHGKGNNPTVTCIDNATDRVVLMGIIKNTNGNITLKSRANISIRLEVK